MSAELVPITGRNLPALVDEAGLPLSLGGGGDWSDVDDGDLCPDDGRGRIPRMPLNRKLGGGWTDDETGETGILSLPFVWLARSTSRAWWPEAFGRGEKAPQCRSDDGIVPTEDSPQRQSDRCATCPHSKWADDLAPACMESVEALVFLPSDYGEGRLRLLRFAGLAIKPAKAYWSSFAARRPKRPPLSVLSEATLQHVDTPNGPFLVPAFRPVNELTREQAQPLIAERDALLEQWRAQVAEEVRTGDAVGDADDDEEVLGEGTFDTPPATVEEFRRPKRPGPDVAPFQYVDPDEEHF